MLHRDAHRPLRRRQRVGTAEHKGLLRVVAGQDPSGCQESAGQFGDPLRGGVLHEVREDLNETREGAEHIADAGIRRPADFGLQVRPGILQHLQFAGRGGCYLVVLVVERLRVVVARLGVAHRLFKCLVRLGQTEDRRDVTGRFDAQVFEHTDSALPLVLQPGDELDEDIGELRRAPRGLDLLCGNPSHLGEQVEFVTATPDGFLHLGEHTRDDTAREFGRDADRCQRTRQADHLIFGEACELAHSGDLRRCVRDLRFCSGRVDADLQDRRGDVIEVLAGRTHDRLEPRDRLARFVERQVGGGRQLRDRLGEVSDGFFGYAQLSAEGSDVRQVLEVRGRDRGGHLLQFAA